MDGRKRCTASQLIAQLLDSSTSVTLTSLSHPSSLPHPSAKPRLFAPPVPLDGPISLFYQPRSSGSRYRTEFEELEFLGRGGGGQVVKARNRLDGHLYAVKKIRLPNDRISDQKILREVTIWSRMNHPKLVPPLPFPPFFFFFLSFGRSEVRGWDGY